MTNLGRRRPCGTPPPAPPLTVLHLVTRALNPTRATQPAPAPKRPVRLPSTPLPVGLTTAPWSGHRPPYPTTAWSDLPRHVKTSAPETLDRFVEATDAGSR
ncbi:hypothetical protein GCM10022214_76820 [Actinomadura miaoliensis]|uniref:Uncharacterized protein n=1 Tax=Actinomadura miaoliensis TaxID=430685 RepID=A0ABP7WYP4_9ACTN